MLWRAWLAAQLCSKLHSASAASVAAQPCADCSDVARLSAARCIADGGDGTMTARELCLAPAYGPAWRGGAGRRGCEYKEHQVFRR